MQQIRLIHALAIASLILTAAACTRSRQAPEQQTTTGLQPRADRTTVAGCLRPGLAENTFVLTTEKTEGGVAAATYQLIGTEAIKLRDYVGQQVEVSGTVRAEEQVASTGESEAKRAKGTVGTPTVETKTEVDIKRLAVENVKPTGNRCPD